VRTPEATYTAIRAAGGLFPADLIARIAAADRELPGARPDDYHLAANERLGEAASRSWDYLRGAYRAFRDRIDPLPATDPATTPTRDRWLLVLLNELGFGRVPYNRAALPAGGRTFPVSHLWQHVPIHLVGWNIRLDQRSGQGETGRAPQSMLQDFLNTSDEHLWGVLSNGRQLRILRDSTALVGSAYLEFDLEAIFDGELYSDFVLLYACLHSSRFELLDRPDAAPTPADCWLERWRAWAAETGIQVRHQLRAQVEQAIVELGTGFLEANAHLRQQLELGPTRGGISDDDLHHELLRLIYQLIFVFVAEDREALPDRQAPPEPRHRYLEYFSTGRLRRIATRRRGDRHRDLWRALVMVLDGMGADDGLPELALPALGGLFFRAGKPNGGDGVHPDLLRDCELANDRLLAAVRLLAQVRDQQGRLRRVNYRHLGADELGSVYESLLELKPRIEPGPRFRLEILAGNQRKETGSYYTPTSLIDALLDTALDPVINEHAASGRPDDLLKITVCDPACGSGHFLVAAARRIAKRYAAMLHGDDEPAHEQVQQVMAKVVRHCIYGVDINPLAAELAKVSLWLESLEPGRPLAFLDAHIKVGNALLGATPKLLQEGLPDEAFKILDRRDTGQLVALLKRDNRKQRDQGTFTLFGTSSLIPTGNTDLAKQAHNINTAVVNTLADVREQARRLRDLEDSPARRRATAVANAWCAAFVWPKNDQAPSPVTTQTIRQLADGESMPHDAATLLADISAAYRFFHWHIEFPDVFHVPDDGAGAHPDTGWRGGFSCIVGNPPWEKVELKQEEFFSAQRPDIANAPNAAARKKMIAKLAASDDPVDQGLHAAFEDELRRSAGWSHLLRSSGRYPLTGQGRLNTYVAFAESARTLLAPRGRAGLVLPTGIATDATTARFFGDLVRTGRLAAFLEFENEEFLLSRAVDHRVRFCLLTLTGTDVETSQAVFAFGARKMADVEPRSFAMPPADILLLNPNTGTASLFRSSRDAQITLDIYRRVPVLWQEEPVSNPWNLFFLQGLFNMATDSGAFRTREQLEPDGWKLEGNVFVRGRQRALPLYEAKMIHYFDHRLGTYEGQTEAQANMGTLPRLTPKQKADPHHVVLPRYWVDETAVEAKLARRWSRGWLLGWRDICRSTDERTIIASPIPRAAVGDKFLLAFPDTGGHLLAANLAAIVLDYCARQKHAGTSFKYFLMKQLPVLPPNAYQQVTPWETTKTLAAWIAVRVTELTFNAWDTAQFAHDFGDSGAPFIWDEERRFAIRAELDAAYFHLYGVERGDVEYILDTFTAFRNNDPDRFARTKALILQVYDAMADATKGRAPYRALLDPPPGQGLRHPGTRT